MTTLAFVGLGGSAWTALPDSRRPHACGTATLIHENSRPRLKSFVAVSRPLLSEALIESKLFGHERGAFTGAIRDRPGRLQLAEGGTVFLDDIDDVPLFMQVKLLRVLQNRTIERIGGTRTVPVNVRIIAGTKHDLQRMVAAGTFREDLYSPQRPPSGAAAAPGAPRRHPGADGSLPRGPRSTARRRSARDLGGRHRRPPATPVAGQRAGIRKRLPAYRADLHLRHARRRLRLDDDPVARGAGRP